MNWLGAGLIIGDEQEAGRILGYENETYNENWLIEK